MAFEDPVSLFVARLAGFRVPGPYQDKLRNPYSDPRRRENLRLYLTLMRRRRPRVLLVGRDPGHRGCALTGIPFTSEAIAARGTLPSGERLACSGTVVGPGVGYFIPFDRPPVSEASASIIWEGIHRYFEDPPLLWNVLPFHPHRSGNPRSNRLPALVAETLAFGLPYLIALFDLFPSVDTVLAAGERAGEVFRRLEKENGLRKTVYFLRHPSYGGKCNFFEQLQRLKGEGRI
jgi:uracil-DNA glycosylase